MSLVSAARASAQESRALRIQASRRLPSPRVVLALARIETKKILLHPLFLGTMGVSALFLTRAVGREGSGGVGIAWLVAGLSLGLAAGGFLSVNVATQRARRDRVLELFGSLPAPAESRTGAVLLGGLFGPVVLALLVAGIGGLLLEADPEVAPYIDLALMVQIPLTVAALGSLAVALGRWLPSPVTAPVVLVAQVMTGIVWVVPWIATTRSGIRVGWHLTYLVSLVVLWSAVALVRDRRAPLRLIVAGLALAVAVSAALSQIPPGGLQ